MTARPSGTVTFLFTDIEGSTRRWELDPAEMQDALAVHDGIVREAVARHDGLVFATGGDGFAVAFGRAADAVASAVEAQRELQAAGLPPVRMGVHSGEAVERDGDYFGAAVNRAARLMAVGHGGQILCTAVTVALIDDSLPTGASMRALGEHRLRDLSEPESVFQVSLEGMEVVFPPLRSADAVRGNLPPSATSLVGRERELREISKLMRETRMVTLTGVGGVGKTRLALEAGADAQLDYPHGVWFVELSGAGDREAFDETVAAALGVQQRSGVTLAVSVSEYLQSKTLLIVLDNCEHLLPAAAGFVESVMRSAPGVRVLATSREGLAVSGERLVAVPSLELPHAAATTTEQLGVEAVRLFLQRASESRADFECTDDQVAAVAALCARLDGIPLAIELAAARVRVMRPAEIAARLDRRFKLLTGGRRTAVTRHQTLRGTIDWSYDLLDDAERRLFRRLSVFAGGFDLDAAEAIVVTNDLDVDDVLDVLVRLVDKSLVVADEQTDSTRYRLLETIRDYAWERLGEAREGDECSRRHAEYFVGYAERAGAGVRSAEELMWADRVERELDNLRAALAWAVTATNVDLAVRHIAGLSTFNIRMGAPFALMAETVGGMTGAADHPLFAITLASAAWPSRIGVRSIGQGTSRRPPRKLPTV